MKPISMKYSKEQFEKIRPILESNKHITIDHIHNSFLTYCYLTNNYRGKTGHVSNIGTASYKIFNREVFEEWDENKFLECCDMEHIPGKWYHDGEGSVIRFSHYDKHNRKMCDQWINQNGEFNSTGGSTRIVSYVPVDPSKFSEYLPEGHPDKGVNIPEYVECVNGYGWGGSVMEGVIYDTKVNIPGTKRTWVSRLKNHPVDFRPSTKEEFEKQNNFSIKAGDYLYCHTDLVMEDDSFIAATKGKVYKSEVDGCFTNNNGEKEHEVNQTNKWFRKATKEEFEKQNNKTVMSKQKLRVSITDVLKIHSIACGAWKAKIASDYLPRVNSDQNITFTQLEINKMFDAASNPKQLTVLEEVFGKQSKPINWCDIKTGSKVMISHTGQHCGGFNNIDNSLPVDVVFFNTLSRINGNGDFFNTESPFPKCKYCTFHQNGKYVLFTNDGEDYKKYITSVVEY